jgi:hypothetical protein
MDEKLLTLIRIATATGTGINPEIVSDLLDLIEQLRSVLERVEWVAEDPYVWCPWCHGQKPQKPPERLPDDTDERYEAEYRFWEFHGPYGGHRPDCPRQAALKMDDVEARKLLVDFLNIIQVDPEVEQLRTTNREMLEQLNIATDLGQKRFEKIEQLRQELTDIRKDLKSGKLGGIWAARKCREIEGILGTTNFEEE